MSEQKEASSKPRTHISVKIGAGVVALSVVGYGLAEKAGFVKPVIEPTIEKIVEMVNNFKPIPEGCTVEGGIGVELKPGEYFLLDGERLDWTGRRFEADDWNVFGENRRDVNDAGSGNINYGDVVYVGLTQYAANNYYRNPATSEWSIVRCDIDGGKDAQFVVWRTEQPQPPTPTPTPGPATTIP